ncbi:DUF3616 domain-containing protein [Polaromonas hydrogenivorans]
MLLMTQNPTPSFLPLTGLYEPSGVQQLADGRFLVVEDEQGHAFSLVEISASGPVNSTPLGPGWFDWGNKDFWKLEDLEGLAIDTAGCLYAVTSHSRDDDGMEKKPRDRLVRFRVDANRVVEPRVAKGLKPALMAAHPLLAAAARIKNVKAGGGLNIEGLAISPDQQRLLIGFRSPLRDGHALIASVENLCAVFEEDAAPQVSGTLQTLDLEGQGIRGMCHMAALDGYLVIGGPVSREGEFKLWFWSGQAGAPARRVTVPGLQGFGNAEGVCPAVIDGAPKIVIVSDDGNRKEGRCAHFLLLDPGTLQIAP